jgi:hypothetical protein
LWSHHGIIRRGIREATSEQQKSINHETSPHRFVPRHGDESVLQNGLAFSGEKRKLEKNFFLLLATKFNLSFRLFLLLSFRISFHFDRFLGDACLFPEWNESNSKKIEICDQ